MNRSTRMIVRILITILAAGLLSRVIFLHPPRAKFEVRLRQVEPQLTEIDLVNTGNADGSPNTKVLVSWQSAKLVAAEALTGFKQTVPDDQSISFILDASSKAPLLHPQETRAIGWVRLSQDSPVRAQLQSGQ